MIQPELSPPTIKKIDGAIALDLAARSFEGGRKWESAQRGGIAPYGSPTGPSPPRYSPSTLDSEKSLQKSQAHQ
jgi:hypothetical protein